jgi:molybdopterin molybdotransferase
MLLPVAEARARILASLTVLPTEWCPLPAALGRVLAQDLLARRDQPPSAVSAMDGYAVRATDAAEPGRVFRVVAEIPAGGSFGQPLDAFEAARIFTGAPLPPGADAVVIQEDAEPVEGGGVRFTAAATPGGFVRPAGLDFRQGQRGFAVGTLLDARAIGLAAAMGHLWLPVRRRPRVGLLATGNELRWPGETPEGSEIVSSNTAMLAAMLAGWGAAPVDLGICPDDAAALAARLRDAAGLDLLVTSGGASVGEHDLVRTALAEEGLVLDFWRIAMRPGKPLLFGTLKGGPVLGFPGNPVSSGVCAIVFLRPALQKMLGLAPHLPQATARLAGALAANDRREDYLRGRGFLAEGELWVETVSRQDSAMLATFALADLLAVRPPFDPPRAAGERVTVIDLHAALASLR